MRFFLKLALGGALAVAPLLVASSALAQDNEGPIVTAGAHESGEALRIREAIAYSYALPRGAPSDDYPFVAWCEALVKGHVALGETLASADPLDLEIIRLGKLEAADFSSALAEARSAQSPAVQEQARISALAASTQWQPLMAQPDQAVRSQAFGLFFGLPGRCEHAARRIRGNITSPPASLEGVGLADAPAG